MDDGQKEMMKDKEIERRCFSFKSRLFTWEKICNICFLASLFQLTQRVVYVDHV